MKSLQLDKPHAIVVVGIQGSGKTFFAEKFAETFSAPYLDSKQLIEYAKNKASAKKLLHSMISQLTRTGKTIVIETDGSKISRTELENTLKNTNYEMLLVWVQVDSVTAMSRARKTLGVTPQEYKENLKKFSAPTASEQSLVISGKHTFASQAKAILKKLSANNRPATQAATHDRSAAPAHHRGNITVR